MVVLHILPNLTPQLGSLWLGWMASQCIDCVTGLSVLAHAPTRHVEWVAAYPWPVIPYNNTHHHEDGMMVLHILPNLDPQLGCCVAWMDGIQVY